MTEKRQNGVYYTEGNPFTLPAFLDWAELAGIKDVKVLEPFAGGNSLIKKLIDLKLCNDFKSYDISPTDMSVNYRDTLEDFPVGYSVCVSNPPWLAKNSATRRGIKFPDTKHDDVYKLALEKALYNCDYVAFLVPESFIRTQLFRDRLHSFISLSSKMFNDTEAPVGLALFTPNGHKWNDDVKVYFNETLMGSFNSLFYYGYPASLVRSEMKFNDPNGNLGLIAIDNTKEASIRFCKPEELDKYEIKPSSRAITKITCKYESIEALNKCLNDFRSETFDIFLTSFKGVRKDGMYRRRLDFKTARDIINYCLDY